MTQRMWFSEPHEDVWDTVGGYWVDYRLVRSWLRHPWTTFRWWRFSRQQGGFR